MVAFCEPESELDGWPDSQPSLPLVTHLERFRCSRLEGDEGGARYQLGDPPCDHSHPISLQGLAIPILVHPQDEMRVWRQNRRRTWYQPRYPILSLTLNMPCTSVRSRSSEAREVLPPVEPWAEVLGLPGFSGSPTVDTGSDTAKTGEALGMNGSGRALPGSGVWDSVS